MSVTQFLLSSLVTTKLSLLESCLNLLILFGDNGPKEVVRIENKLFIFLFNLGEIINFDALSRKSFECLKQFF